MNNVDRSEPYTFSSFDDQKNKLKEELKQIGINLSEKEAIRITFLSRRKYDRYDHFPSGEIFHTRLIKWFINNFNKKERMIAYDVIKCLKFIDEYELKELTKVTFINTKKKIMEELNILHDQNWYSYLEHINISMKSALSRSIYVACADDIRFDYFRRYAMKVHPNIFLKDNFIEYYKINKESIYDLPDNDRIFLIDQLSGSGTTALRRINNTWTGKIQRFINIWEEHLKNKKIYYCPYIISAVAKDNLNNRIYELNKVYKFLDITLLPTYEIKISPCISNDQVNVNIEKPVSKICLKYYNKFVEDEHTKIVGGVPFGYGGAGLTLIFQTNCPNNTLPIIWHDYNEWYPLFPRISHHR